MNTHRALIESSVPPEMIVIAGGPYEHCRTALLAWLDKHPLDGDDSPEYARALIVKVEHVLPPIYPPMTTADYARVLPSTATPAEQLDYEPCARHAPHWEPNCHDCSTTPSDQPDPTCFAFDIDGEQVRLQGMGHPSPEAIEALTELMHALQREGYTLTPADQGERK